MPKDGDRLSETDFFYKKRIAITGGAGTIARELTRQLLMGPVSEVRVIDNNENALFTLGEEYKNEKRFHGFLCDVKHESQLTSLFRYMDYVFHAAAVKHVPIAERSPFEVVQTNIIGIENVIRAASSNGVKRLLFTSSDKAVNPTNVMGTSKLMGERLITAANALIDGESSTIFTSTRFGNVAGSSGSVIPLFCDQIAAGGPVTLTDHRMTRFLMPLKEAVHMVMESIEIACGGEVFVTKMPVVRIADVAEVLVDLLAPVFNHTASSIAIEEFGSRPGEKLYEELINEEELRRTKDLGAFFAILPAFRNIYDRIEYRYEQDNGRQIDKVYNSGLEPAMSKDEIARFLLQPGVLPVEIATKIKVQQTPVAVSM